MDETPNTQPIAGLPENAYRPLAPDEMYRPLIAPERAVPEVTLRSIVFGLAMTVLFSAAAAYIALKPGATLDDAAVIAHCTRHLAEFKRPRVVKFVEDFPKTPIGKIQKNILKAPYWQDRGKRI